MLQMDLHHHFPIFKYTIYSSPILGYHPLCSTTQHIKTPWTLTIMGTSILKDTVMFPYFEPVKMGLIPRKNDQTYQEKKRCI